MAAGARIDSTVLIQLFRITSEGYMYSFVEPNGRRFIWYTSDGSYRGNVGKRYRLLGAVRGQIEKSGEPVIVLNRVRLKELPRPNIPG